MTGSTTFRDAARVLTDALGLTIPPIAVSMSDDIPDGVASYSGTATAGCLFWLEAAKGPIATSTVDHEMCAIGVHTHALAEPSPSHGDELSRVLNVMADLSYLRPDEVAKVPTLEKPTKHVLYAPLSEAPVPPDVVLLFAQSRQGLVIVEAAEQLDPKSSAPPVLGRPACAVIPQVVNSGRPALSLGCCGARAYLDSMSDDIALWAIPGEMVDRYAERIAALAKANQVLTRFHLQRRSDVEKGDKPTVQQSLDRM